MGEENLAVACPKCGSEDTYGITRVVGYFSRTSDWNKSKIAELRDRQLGKAIGAYSVVDGEVAMPLNLDYGEDGVYLAGKSGCDVCEGGKKVLERALQRAGLEGSVASHVFKITREDGSYDAENLRLAAAMGIPFSNIPAFAFVRDGRVVEVIPTIYEEGKPARLITPNALAEKLRGIYAHESSRVV